MKHNTSSALKRSMKSLHTTLGSECPLYKILLVGFVLFCQTACENESKLSHPNQQSAGITQTEPGGGVGNQLTDEMIDMLSLDVSTEQNDQSSLFLETVKNKLREIKKGRQQDVKECITMEPHVSYTLLGLLIWLEGNAGVNIPSELLQCLHSMGMDINKPAKEHFVFERIMPLPFAIQEGAIQTATWLLENRADVSQVTPKEISSLLDKDNINVDGIAALLQRLQDHGFDYKKTDASGETILHLVAYFDENKQKN